MDKKRGVGSEEVQREEKEGRMGKKFVKLCTRERNV